MSAAEPRPAAVQCHGKVKYRTKAWAKQAAKRVPTKSGCGFLQAYRCPHCDFFHIGHRPAKREGK